MLRSEALLRARRTWAWLLPALACALPVSAGEPAVWHMASAVPEGSPVADWAGRLAHAIERHTGGLVKVRMHLGAVLGDETEMITQMKTGRVQLVGGSLGAFEPLIPALSVLETPYLFADDAALGRASRSEPLAIAPVVRLFREQGFEPWGLAFAGWRAISTRTRVRLPADLRGLRIRCQPAPLHEAIFRLLGAAVRPVPLRGVQPGFQEGQFDGIDVPLVWLFGTSAADHVRFHLRTGHVAQGATMVVSRAALATLPRPIRERLLGEGKRFADDFNRTSRDLEAQLLDTLRARGVEVTVPNAAELSAWKAAMAPVRPVALETGGAEGRALLQALERPRGG